MEKKEVIERLEHFGYKYSPEEDEKPLDFAIEKTSWHVKNKTNCAAIPEGLKCMAIDIACAEFLKMKKDFGLLADLEFENIAKSIAMGDTNVTFADAESPEQKFDAAISYLLGDREDEYARYRKMVW